MGISQSRGEFILPLDADDTISPYYMAEAVPILEYNPNIGIVYCRAQKIGKETGEWNLPEYSSQRMAFDNVIFVSAFFRKSDWDLVGGFPAYTRLGMEDYAFWLRILRLGREVYRINKILFNYRIQNASRSTIFNSDKKKWSRHMLPFFGIILIFSRIILRGCTGGFLNIENDWKNLRSMI